MPKLVQDEKGNLFIDEGGGVYTPVDEQQAAAFQGNKGMAANVAQSAGQGIENLITGAGSLLSDNPYWAQANREGRAQSEALNAAQPVAGPAGQFAPQAALGIASAGQGMLPVAALEGALGAATTPETPIQGAAIGALLGGAGEALPGAAMALYGRGRGLVDKLPWMNRGNPLDEVLPTPGIPRPISDVGGPSGGNPLPPDLPPTAPASALTPESAPGAAPRPAMAPISDAVGDLPLGSGPAAAPSRMVERVAAKLDDVRPEGALTEGPALRGVMTPEELYAQGFPTTEAQRSILKASARRPGELQAGEELMRAEAASMSDPITGARVREVYDAQRQGLTNYLGHRLGLEPGVQLTDPVLSDVFQRVGGRMDQIAQAVDGIQLDDALREELGKTMAQVTGSHKAQLERLMQEIEDKAGLHGGLNGKDFSVVRTQLNDMVEAGMRQGRIEKVSDAQEIIKALDSRLEDALPDAYKGELQQLREQYKIAATLYKPGTRDAVGQLNPVSFYSNWKRGQSKKLAGTDDIGRLVNTVITLTKPRVPDSGTARRLLSNAVHEGVGSIPVVGAAYNLGRRVLTR